MDEIKIPKNEEFGEAKCDNCALRNRCVVLETESLTNRQSIKDIHSDLKMLHDAISELAARISGLDEKINTNIRDVSYHKLGTLDHFKILDKRIAELNTIKDDFNEYMNEVPKCDRRISTIEHNILDISEIRRMVKEFQHIKTLLKFITAIAAPIIAFFILDYLEIVFHHKGLL